jgi:hypothetical protein
MVCVATVWKTVYSAKMGLHARAVMSDTNSMLLLGYANLSHANKANTYKDQFVCGVSLAANSAGRRVMCGISFVPPPQFVKLVRLILNSRLMHASSATQHSIGKQ